MRLWHIDLIPYLPKQQLLSQWRELNSIYANENKHILINFVYKYKPIHLLAYSQVVLREMKKRGYKLSFKKYNNYFESKGLDDELILFEDDGYIDLQPFEWDMNNEYLKICCWNLYEKYIRGQEGFTDEAIDFIERRIND